MKTKVSWKKNHTAFSFFAAFLMLSATGSLANIRHIYKGRQDTIVISKTQVSRKYKIRLYPNADHNVLFFQASGVRGKVYQLFVFDLDGRLAKQTQIRNRETTVVANIVKGNYTFEIFMDDERIENGFLVIK